MKNTNKIIATLPFKGRWIVGATPADKVPSHGTDLFGVTYAYDFMAVDENNKVSAKVSWRTLFKTEKPEDFYSFGAEVLSPVSGTIIKIHDGESDNIVRRSLFSGIPYMLKQKERIKKGIEKVAGNYIIIKLENAEQYICIVHLKRSSMKVEEGQKILSRDHLASCGNSGNSIQPHIHIQAMDSLDFRKTKGIPLYFESFCEGDQKSTVLRTDAFPNKNKIINSTKN